MKKLLIFGEGPSLPRLIHEIERSALYDIVGIVVPHATAPARNNIPLYTLETLPAFDRQEVSAFIVGDEQHLNQQRLAAYMEVKRMGYAITAICSAGASIADGLKLRENVFIDHGARVLADANIGANTWIMQGAEIDADTKIGSSCWIGAQCIISAGATLGKNCTLGGHRPWRGIASLVYYPCANHADCIATHDDFSGCPLSGTGVFFPKMMPFPATR